MNDFWFFTGALVLTAAIAGVWCICAELFKRGLNNDWCRHDWGMWESVVAVVEGSSICSQHRFCRKCNKAERRIL
jgi:hypothetical protein